MFRALGSSYFPPFGDLRLDFPPVENKPADLAEVHLLTGVNGTGKTRILCALSAMLGNPEPFGRRLIGLDKSIQLIASEEVFPSGRSSNPYARFDVNASEGRWALSGPIMQWAIEVPAFAYSGVAYVSDTPITVMADVPKPDRAACLSFVRAEEHSKALLQAISNLKVQAAMDWMNQSGEAKGQTRATRIVTALESTISQITAMSFSFMVTSYPKAALEVSWGGSKLSFNTLPDGLRSIIGWLAHSVVMMDAYLQGKEHPLDAEAVFLLDEIEGPLHPAWQRRILPAFQRLFPKAQMFVATHSPFLIASLNHGWIHPLAVSPDGTVRAEKVVAASEGDSYVSVLEDIMGVKEWYDPQSEQLLAEFRSNRDAAYRGNAEASATARRLAGEIGNRSMELGYMMGQEMRQMDRQLAKGAAE